LAAFFWVLLVVAICGRSQEGGGGEGEGDGGDDRVA